jgi:hypothetical protein
MLITSRPRDKSGLCWRPTRSKWLVLPSALLFGSLILIYLVALLPERNLFGDHCLPAWLRGKNHDDYYFYQMRWIPRSATSWCIPQAPILLLGNQRGRAAALDGRIGPKPVPQPGEWQVSVVQLKRDWPLFLPYVAWTTKDGTHFRFGARWDDIDHYYTFPSIAIAPQP